MRSGTGPWSTTPTSRSSIDRTSRSSSSLRTTASISSWLAVMPPSEPISASRAGRGALSQASSTARESPVSTWRRRRQVRQGGQPFRHVLIPVVLLAGEPPQDRPGQPEPQLAGPLEQLDVLPPLDALVHEPEHLAVQRLDTRLDPHDPGVDQRGHLGPADVRLDLVEDPPAPALPMSRQR